MKGNIGIAALTAVISGIAQETASTLDADWLVMGTVLADRSIQVDGFRHAFKPGEYLEIDSFRHIRQLLTQLRAITNSGAESAGVAHTHALTWPDLPVAGDAGSALSDGERVLCAWVNRGGFNKNPTLPTDLVVLGRLYVSE